MFGWFLGILSSFIVGYFRKKQKQAEVIGAIRIEVDELKRILVLTVYRLAAYQSENYRNLLLWALDNLKAYKGIFSNETPVQTFEKLLKLSDQELETLSSYRKNETIGISAGMKTMEIPYVNNNLEHLKLLSTDDQRRILDIRRRLNIINQDIGQAKEFLHLTFTPALTTDNSTRLSENIDVCFKSIATQCRELVQQISSLSLKSDLGDLIEI